MRVWFMGVVVLASIGCLPDGEPVEGRKILGNREARRPVIVQGGAQLFVIYETSKPASAPQPWSPRLWATPYQGGEPRRLAENGAWPVIWEENSGTALVLHDIAGHSADPVVRWYPGIRAGLARVDLASGVPLKDFSDIVDFGFWNGRLFVENAASGKPLRQIVVEQPDGRHEFLQPAAEVKWSSRREVFLLVPETQPADSVLVRARRPGATPEVIQRGATQFMIHPSENIVLLAAVVSSPSGAKVEQRMVNLTSGQAERVYLPEGCSWLGFVPQSRQFLCAQGPEDAPGEVVEKRRAVQLHLLALDGGEDRSFTLSVQDHRGLGVEWAPGKARAAILRDHHRLWLLRPDADPPLHPLGQRTLRSQFSPDGRFVAYVEVGTPAPGQYETRLVVQDVDLAAPPRLFTPELAFTQSQFFTEDSKSLLFISHFGDYRARLHVADLATGEQRVIASDIGWWIWPWGADGIVIEPQLQYDRGRVLVITNWSLQDRVGDLVLLDPAAGTERVIARSVADFATTAPCPTCGSLDPGAPMAVVIQERRPSDRDGLWALTLP
jgi:hypothetical protein